MANLKITDLTATTAPVNTDLIEIVQDVATTPVNKKITLLDLVGTGWIGISGTFSYASATTINVSSGAASIYSVGDKLRFQNNDSGTYLYAYIVTVADTLLTVKGNAVPNATLTDAYYSHQENPLGFPDTFAYTPAAIVGFASTPGDSSYIFSLKGRVCTVFFDMSDGGTTSNSVNTSFTLPIACSASGYAFQAWCAVYDNGVWILSSGHIYFAASATVATVCKAAITGGDWTASGGKSAIGQFSYPI